MATFRERKNADGTAMWEVQIRLRGFPTETASHKRLTDARKWAAATEAAMREGRYFPQAEAKRRTVGDLIDRYVREVLPDKKDKGSQGPQLAWWKGELGALTLADLTPARIGEARDRLALREIESKAKPEAERPKKPTGGRKPLKAPPPEPKRISPATVNRYLAALGHALTVAVKEWGWLDDSPMRKVRKKTEPKGRVRFLDDAERKRLLEACRLGPPWLLPVVTLALATGMRQGEILGLRWPDVDLVRKRIVMHETKNGERRAVPISGAALDTFKAWSKVRRMDTDLVFPETSGFHHRWWEALERAKLADFRFHDLRHTAASYLAMQGATPSEIAEVLGHKTLQMVRRYAHLSDSHVAGVLERMNTKVFGKGAG